MYWLRRLFARSTPQTLPSIDAYARWAAAYPAHAHNALMRAEEAALVGLLPPLDGRTVLDLACGSGRYAQIAQARGAAQVIALDNSPHMLAQVALRLRGLATMDALPLATSSVDVIVCGLAIGHVQAITPVLAACARVLTPDGVLLISDVHPLLFIGGARRTFSSGGATFAVEHYVHLYSDMHAAARTAGLIIDAIAEPRLLPEDRQPGAPSTPVAIVYRLRHSTLAAR
ncbi:MAG: class I SAM-dependent methyltransferase [Chloroflexota bacterium]|nr:class I SAM-dependent methyltransferase [Chloroflexota bacterium]